MGLPTPAASTGAMRPPSSAVHPHVQHNVSVSPSPAQAVTTSRSGKPKAQAVVSPLPRQPTCQKNSSLHRIVNQITYIEEEESPEVCSYV